MNPDWKAFLENAGARFTDPAQETELSFGDAPAELAAARDATVLVPLTHLGVIRASGEEAAPFLHNLMTNDAQHLHPGQAQHNSLCTAKGRMLASFLVWRQETDYLLHLSRDIHAAILKKLSMYVLRSKVKLSDASGEMLLLGIAGKDAAAAVAALGADLPQPMSTAPLAGGTAIRLEGERFLLALPVAAAPGIWQQLCTRARPAGTAAWRWLDIRAGIPRISAPVQEEFVPQMTNFELIGGVSFKKGCYPGQEIVARTQYLGKIKRRMYLAHLAEDARPGAGTPLYGGDAGDQSVGVVVDAAPAPGGGHDLLAVVVSGSADGGDVHVDAPSGPKLQFQPLPYAVA